MEKWKTIYKNLMKVLEYTGIREIASIAAAAAFWLFLSLVPMVTLAVSVLPFTSLGEEQLMVFLSPVLPSSLKDLIAVIVTDIYRSNLAILSVSILATVWSSAKGFSFLIFGLEQIYARKRRTGYLSRRFRGMLYTVSMLVFVAISVLAVGFGGQIIGVVKHYFPSSHKFFDFLLRFRFILVIVLLTLYFTGIYTRGCGQRLRFKEVLPGAVFTAICWSLLSWVFSAWISAGSFGTYGSLATVVIVMLWLYYSQYMLLMGACLNRAIPGGLPKIQQKINDVKEKRRGSK